MSLALLLICFVAMEPLTYVAHRWLMHGAGWVLHKSHHARIATRFEANDLFPVIFAAITMIVLALANGWEPLWSVGFGVTLYGFTYMFVHDIAIHQRLPFPARLLRFLQPLRNAHRIHHLYGGEPYGMLVPVVPKELRERAARTDRDPLGDRIKASAK